MEEFDIERIKGRLCNIAMALMLFSSMFFGCLIIPLFLWIIFVDPVKWRHVADRVFGCWLKYPVAIIELFHGLKVYSTTDSAQMNPNERALFIVNHRTRLDWLYMWPYLYRQNPSLLDSLKIILKNDLKNIPYASWGMECVSFVFLSRNWQKDKERLEGAVDVYAKTDKPYQVLFFPEGTVINPSDPAHLGKIRSDEWAERHGLPKYNFVLHPRTTGFAHLVEQMRKNNYLDAVYDITLGYPDTIAQRESDFIVKGVNPSAICFHTSRHANADIPGDEDGVAGWLCTSFARKEALLKHFYGCDHPMHPVKSNANDCAASHIDNDETIPQNNDHAGHSSETTAKAASRDQINPPNSVNKVSNGFISALPDKASDISANGYIESNGRAITDTLEKGALQFPNARPMLLTAAQQLELKLVFAFWFTAGCIAVPLSFVWYSTFMKIYSVAVTLMFLSFRIFGGGVDRIEVDMFNKLVPSRVASGSDAPSVGRQRRLSQGLVDDIRSSLKNLVDLERVAHEG